MVVVKTCISVDRDLLAKVTALAHALRMSRSELVGIAIKDFLEEYENKQLLDRLNAVYGDGPDPDDERMLADMRRLYNHCKEANRL